MRHKEAAFQQPYYMYSIPSLILKATLFAWQTGQIREVALGEREK